MGHEKKGCYLANVHMTVVLQAIYTSALSKQLWDIMTSCSIQQLQSLTVFPGC